MFWILIAFVFAAPGAIEKTQMGWRYLPLWLVVVRELTYQATADRAPLPAEPAEAD